MKRVRYLAGAAGLVPITLAMAGTPMVAHAAAGPANAKRVSLHHVHGHPGLGPRARARVRPDINRVNCSKAGDWLYVFQSNDAHADCFANAGSEVVKIYKIDSVYTGNNGVYYSLSHDGKYWDCSDPYKNTWVNPSSCGYAVNEWTMDYIDIFPGKT
jgi:hypothetical protein